MIRAVLLALLLLAICPAASRAQTPELDALEAEYAGVAAELRSLSRQAEATDQPRTRIETLRSLRGQVEDVKLRLAILAGRLAALRESAGRLRLHVAIGDYGGTAIDRPLDSGDVLAATAEFKPAQGTAVWRLLGPGDVPVPGAEKNELVDGGEGFQARFKIQVKDLPAGAYAVLFEFRSAEGEAMSARHAFEIAPPLTELPRFTVEGRFESPDAPLDRPARAGDTLAFSAAVPLVGSDGRGVVGVLAWQVYDGGDRPVPGFGKAVQTYETGGVEQARFRFQPTTLPDDEYTVVLTHRLAADESVSTLASSRFTFSQPVRITRLVVADSPAGTEHRAVIRSHLKPHLFAYFSLRPEVKRGEVWLVVRDTDGGVVAQTTKTVANKGGEQRLGMVPDKNLPNGPYILEARLREAGGGATESKTSFTLADYSLPISGPREIQSGDRAPFGISLPADFVAPVTVDVETGSGVIVTRTPNGLSGSVSGIAEDSSQSARLTAVAVDAEGRRATGQHSFIIRPIPKPEPEPRSQSYASTPSYEAPSFATPQPPPVTPAPSAAPSSSPSENDAQQEIRNIMSNLNKDLQRIEAEKQARLQQIQREYATPARPPSSSVVPSSRSVPIADGTYSTTFETMRLSRNGNRVVGTFAFKNGRLEGTLSGNRLSGVWVQSSSNVRCGSSRGGSNYWGNFQFSFTSDGNFSGGFDYCGGGGGGNWTGKRQ